MKISSRVNSKISAIIENTFEGEKEKKSVIEQFENKILPFKYDGKDIYPTYVSFDMENPDVINIDFIDDIDYSFIFTHRADGSFTVELATAMWCLDGDNYRAETEMLNEDHSFFVDDIPSIFDCLNTMTISENMLNGLYYSTNINGKTKYEKYEPEKYPLLKNMVNYANNMANSEFLMFLDAIKIELDDFEEAEDYISRTYNDIWNEVVDNDACTYMRINKDIQETLQNINYLSNKIKEKQEMNKSAEEER